MFLCFLLTSFLITQQFGGACGCEDKPQINTLAVVNGIKITKQELGTETQNRITLLQSEVISAREAEVDRQINQFLLEAEAKRRGITPAQLVQQEVTDKVESPSSAEVKEFYESRKDRIGKDLKSVRTEIISIIKAERERVEAVRFTNALRNTVSITMSPTPVTPPSSEEELDRVFAQVSTRKITSRDVEAGLKKLIFNVQQRVYEVRKQDLDLRINDLLLEQEAKRLNTSTHSLIANAVRAKMSIITDQRAKSYYEKNRTRYNTDFDKVKFQIIALLTRQEEQKLARDYAEELRKKAAVQIYLLPPSPPR